MKGERWWERINLRRGDPCGRPYANLSAPHIGPNHRTPCSRSFRDQCAHWSWESVIPSHKSKGGRIATTSDIGHWFRNDRRFYKECGATPGGGLREARATAWLVGADDPVRPGPTTQHLVGQGPCALPRGCCKANSHPCSQIISTPISAGETPEMRLAWPRFSGRTALSFSRASRRRPRIAV